MTTLVYRNGRDLGRGGFPFIHYRRTCTDGIGEALRAEETKSRLLSKVGIVCMSAYLTDALVSAYDWGELDISDPDAVRARVNHLIAFQEEQFWTVGWTSSSLDTLQGATSFSRRSPLWPGTSAQEYLGMKGFS